MADLLPCPFCGGKAHYTKEILSAGLAAVVMCSDNDCCTNHAGTLQEAIDLWNTRSGALTNEGTTRPAAPVDGLDVTDRMLNEGQERLCQLASRTHFDDHFQAEIYKAMRAVDPCFTHVVALRNSLQLAKDMFKANGLDLPNTVEVIDSSLTIHPQAEAIIAAERAEKEQAIKELKQLVVSFVREHFPENKTFNPFDDLLGLISQIDNASTVARSYVNKITTLEADNAALTARMKELGTVNAKMCDDVIDYELNIAERDVSLKAIETQLTEARKALEHIDSLSRADGPWDQLFYDAQQIAAKARAALGDNP